MFLEFNWTAGVYQGRLGATFTAIGGCRSFASLEEAKAVLNSCGLILGRKTDSRTWEILSI